MPFGRGVANVSSEGSRGDPMAGRRQGENGHGFTLIELLVVVSAVGLLMAILLTSLGRVRKASRATACLSNVRQWGMALQAGAADEEGMVLKDTTVPWWHAIRGYGDSGDVLLCPEAAKPGPPEFVNRTAFQAWGSSRRTPDGGGLGSYGVNSWLLGADRLRQLANTYDWWGNPVFEDYAAKRWYWNTRSLASPGSVPLLFDCVTESAHPEETDDPPTFDGDFSIALLREGPVGRQTLHMRWACVNRHPGGKIGMTFMDGSARTVGLKELWTLRWHRCSTPAGYWTTAGGVLPADWPAWMRSFRDY